MVWNILALVAIVALFLWFMFGKFWQPSVSLPLPLDEARDNGPDDEPSPDLPTSPARPDRVSLRLPKPLSLADLIAILRRNNQDLHPETGEVVTLEEHFGYRDEEPDDAKPVDDGDREVPVDDDGYPRAEERPAQSFGIVVDQPQPLPVVEPAVLYGEGPQLTDESSMAWKYDSGIFRIVDIRESVSA